MNVFAFYQTTTTHIVSFSLRDQYPISTEWQKSHHFREVADRKISNINDVNSVCHGHKLRKKEEKSLSHFWGYFGLGRAVGQPSAHAQIEMLEEM